MGLSARNIREYLPPVLMGIGMSTGANAIFEAVKATTASVREIDACEEELDKLDIFRMCWKHYIPCGVSTIVSAGSFIWAACGYSSQLAGATAIATYFEKTYADYRKKNIDLNGEENDERVRSELACDHIKDNPPPSDLVRLARDKASYLIWEPITKQWLTMTDQELNWFERQLNRAYSKEQKFTLNQALKLVPGASVTRKEGDMFMWWADDDYYEFIYYNESFFGRPMMSVDLIDVVGDDGDRYYELAFSQEPITAANWDDSDYKDAQDLQAL